MRPGRLKPTFAQPIGHVQVQGRLCGVLAAAADGRDGTGDVKAIAGAVTESSGGRGIFGVELFVKGDQVWFSEVSPRPHDTGMVTMVSQAQSEFELHARAILGLPVALNCVARWPAR